MFGPVVTVAGLLGGEDPTAAPAAVGALPVGERASVLSGGLKQRSDEALKQLPSELVARLLALHRPPVNPSS